MRTIRAGDHGDDVADVQHRLLAIGDAIDGSELGGRYGPSTEAAVRAFQQRRGLLVDGVVGAETWAELVEAGFSFGDRTLYLRNPNLRGDDVRALQRRLSALGFDAGREDGIFGERCDQAVREFQRNIAMRQDGIVGKSGARLHLLTNEGFGPVRYAVAQEEQLEAPPDRDDQLVPAGEAQVHVTASFGVAAFPESHNADELMTAADLALYGAKRQGKDRVVTVNPEMP